MIRVAILGATGYTALELLKLLLRHPSVEITAATSRQEGRPLVSSVHPSLVGRIGLVLEDLSPEEIVERSQCVFSCLPHAFFESVAITSTVGRSISSREACCRGIFPWCLRMGSKSHGAAAAITPS